MLYKRYFPLLAIVLVSALGAWTHPKPAWLNPSLAWAAPSKEHLLGCGDAGVDIAAVLSHAELRAIALASIVSLWGFVVGTTLGAAAALRRGTLERIVERTSDLLQAFPTFLLALAVLSAVRSPTRFHLGVVFALTAWAPFARLALAQARVLRDAPFVEAAGAIGAPFFQVIRRHVIPNLVSVVAVQLGSTASAIVVSEAALAFVGLGPRDAVSLGSVIDQGVVAMLRAPHVLVAGALTVFLTSASLLLVASASSPARGRG